LFGLGEDETDFAKDFFGDWLYFFVVGKAFIA
jgi:hypothetical protein